MKVRAAVLAADEEVRSEYANALHLVSQKKGGVGKSVIAGWIAEYLLSTGRSPKCYDTDPGNQTFSRMRGLDVKMVELVEEGDVRPILFDGVLQEIIDQEGPFVMDTGASGFFHFWNYVLETDVFSVLSEHDRPVIVHVPIAPIPDLADTLECFGQICQMVPDRSVVVWLKQHIRPIRMDDKGFWDLPIAKNNEQKLLGVVIAKAELRKELTRLSMDEILSKNLTFSEGERDLGSFHWNRIRPVKNEVFGWMRKLGI